MERERRRKKMHLSLFPANRFVTISKLFHFGKLHQESEKKITIHIYATYTRRKEKKRRGKRNYEEDEEKRGENKEKVRALCL